MKTKPLKSLPHAGFSLLELMVTVTIIGVLCAIAIPGFTRLRERSVNTLLSNELRVASHALQYYVIEKGTWPPDGAGTWPVELTGYLPPPDRWALPSPIGGTWAWSLNSDDTLASLRINNPTVDADRLARIDRMLDDGNTTTGTLFLADQSLVYVLEK